MIQTFKENPRPNFAHQILGNIGKGIGSFGEEFVAQKLKGKQKEKEKSEMNEFASNLEKNFPDSPMHKAVADLYRSDLPSDQKSQIIKSLVGIDPLKIDQQRRLQEKEMRTKYSQRIKEEQVALKEQTNLEERRATGQRIRQLQNERDQALGFEFDDEKLDSPKVKFDPENPEHIKKFEQLDKKFKGDRKKVNEALAREFTL